MSPLPRGRWSKWRIPAGFEEVFREGKCPCDFVFTASLVVAGSAAAQTATGKSDPVLDPASMDKGIDPCADFTLFLRRLAEEESIPPDQTSWGVSSKLQDENLLVLRDILEKARPRIHSQPHHSENRRLLCACMDEKSVNAAELAPMKKEVQAIDRLMSKEDIAALAAEMIYDDVLFDFRSDQDYKNSAQVIAEVDQGGLSLPDRDFYLLQDTKTIKAAQGLCGHVRRMFDLLGDAPGLAEDESHAVMRIETALAKGSMSRVDRRDPRIFTNKMSRAELQALSPNFPVGCVLRKSWLAELNLAECGRSGFFKTMNAQLKKKIWPAGRLTCTGTLRTPTRLPSGSLCECRLRLLWQDSTGRKANRAALEALCQFN